jgi:adenylyltransferase/sulfurtransferase
MKEMTVSELKARLDRGDRPFLLDVRQPEEFAESRIEGSVLIPLNELPARVGELDPSRELIVICRSGARSARACQQLEERGFRDVTNLVGGNLAWQALIKS